MGKLKLNLKKSFIKDIIQEVIAILEPILAKNSQKFRVYNGSKMIESTDNNNDESIYNDPDRLRLIHLNIINYILKKMGEGEILVFYRDFEK